ncbi:MAG: hypothetical protein R2703_12805 [Micropruina glycogenica]
MQTTIEDALARRMLNGEILDGDTVRFDVNADNSGLVVVEDDAEGGAVEPSCQVGDPGVRRDDDHLPTYAGMTVVQSSRRVALGDPDVRQDAGVGG